MSPSERENGSPAIFVTTRWSMVLAAGESESEKSASALEQLCGAYWYPLYAFARRTGVSETEAQDLTQEFFARMLAKNQLAPASPERGKFRSFLLTMFKRFMANEWHAAHAQKRGGGQVLLSLDETDGEERYKQEAAHSVTPDKLFEQSWAITLLQQAEDQLRKEHVAAGKARLFEELKTFLSGDRTGPPQAEVAASLGMEVGAVKVAIHRLRVRYRECLRAQIAETVSSAAELEEEIHSLFTAFQS